MTLRLNTNKGIHLYFVIIPINFLSAKNEVKQSDYYDIWFQ